jgi:hypothetical protein
VFKWGRLHFFFDWSASSSRVSSSIREKNHLDLVDAFSDDGTRAPCHTHLNPYQRIENVPFLFTAFHLAIVMALFSPFFSPTNYRYCLAYNRIIGHHGLDHEYKRAVTSWKKLDWRNYTRVDGFEMIRFSHLAILLAICPSLSSFFFLSSCRWEKRWIWYDGSCTPFRVSRMSSCFSWPLLLINGYTVVQRQFLYLLSLIFFIWW